MPDLTMMGLWYLVLLFSMVAHEASHACMAMRLGDNTAYDGGQVSFDPWPHMQREPFGTILIPIISYLYNGWMIGWASIPVDPNWSYHNPKLSAWVSLAGPLANLGIVICAGILMRIGIHMGLFLAPDFMNFTVIVAPTQQGFVYAFAVFLSILFSLNVLLFVFNLLPVPPLDGSGIVPLFIKDEESAVRYMHFVNNRTFYFIGILVAWHVFDYIFHPVHVGFVNFLYWGIASY